VKLTLVLRPVAILDALCSDKSASDWQGSDIMSESGISLEFARSLRMRASICVRRIQVPHPRKSNLMPTWESDRLTVYELSGDAEKELYVDCAAELDDGEAMSLALAYSRGFSMRLMTGRPEDCSRRRSRT